MNGNNQDYCEISGHQGMDFLEWMHRVFKDWKSRVCYGYVNNSFNCLHGKCRLVWSPRAMLFCGSEDSQEALLIIDSK